MSWFTLDDAMVVGVGIIAILAGVLLAHLKVKGKTPDISRYLVPMNLVIFACAVLLTSIFTGILPISERASLTIYGLCASYFAFSFIYRLSDYVLSKPADTDFPLRDVVWLVM
jgi:hypothetical protein